MNKKNMLDTAKNLNNSNVHVETKDGRCFTGHLNLAGNYLIVGIHEYLVNIDDVSSIRET